MPKIGHPTGSKPTNVIALDTETTGLDFYHGTKPFFVNVCDEEGSIRYWEFNVDPRTRKVDCSVKDWEEIKDTIESAGSVITHNGKFDVTAIESLCPVGCKPVRWKWDRFHDTIIAAHIVQSNQPKNLTDLLLTWAGVDIELHETELARCVKEVRKIAQKSLANWRIASKDDPMMPSSGSEPWRADYWTPRAYAQHAELPAVDPECQHEFVKDLCSSCGGHFYWVVLSEYANQDTPGTLLLWRILRKEIEDRGLWDIYCERMKCLPIAQSMEKRGIAFNTERMEELRGRYQVESVRCGNDCLSIAKDHGYDLDLPKGASPNNSLRTFVYDHLKLPPRYAKKSKTGAPTLDKEAIGFYLDNLPQDSEPLRFIQTLATKRKRDTYLAYMESYERFCIDAKMGKGFKIVHPTLNMTGTDTLRWSSYNPNEQSISKRGLFDGDIHTLRYLFGPGPGREWWSLDAKNVELRLPAYECGERELIDLFERPDDPPYYGSEHLLNFHTVYPDIWDDELRLVGLEKVGPSIKKKYESTWYKYVKNGGFALGYGAVDKADGTGTADRAFRRPGSHARLKSRFANKEKLNQKYIAMANDLGYVETMPDKRICPERGYPIVCPRDERGRIKPTIPLNYHIQSTAMWWTGCAMVKTQALFNRLNVGLKFAGRCWPGGYYLVIQQHDEIVLDVPSGSGRKGYKPWELNLPVIREVQRLMESCGEDLGVPTPVGIEYHEKNWSEGVTV